MINLNVKSTSWQIPFIRFIKIKYGFLDWIGWYVSISKFQLIWVSIFLGKNLFYVYILCQYLIILYNLFFYPYNSGRWSTKTKTSAFSGAVWPFFDGGAICLVDSDNELVSHLLASDSDYPLFRQQKWSRRQHVVVMGVFSAGFRFVFLRTSKNEWQ